MPLRLDGSKLGSGKCISKRHVFGLIVFGLLPNIVYRERFKLLFHARLKLFACARCIPIHELPPFGWADLRGNRIFRQELALDLIQKPFLLLFIFAVVSHESSDFGSAVWLDDIQIKGVRSVKILLSHHEIVGVGGVQDPLVSTALI